MSEETEQSKDKEVVIAIEPDFRGYAYRGSDGALTCFLCDAEMEWEQCAQCGGDGGFDGYEEDPLWYLPGEEIQCVDCNGQGGHHWCPTKTCRTMICTQVVKKP